MHERFRGVVRWLVVVAALVMPAAALAQDTAPPRRSVQADIVDIDGQPTIPGQGTVLELLHPHEGVDVHVRAGGVRPGERVLVLVKGRDEATYRVFGPAVRQAQDEGDLLLVPDVILPAAGSAQVKQYTLRAVVAPAGVDVPNPIASLDRFSAISSPGLEIAVLKWTPAPSALTLDTVDGRPVEPRGEVAVDSSVDVAGTRAPDSARHVYVVVHPINATEFTLVGPAEVADRTWFCRDVRLNFGQPHWRSMELFAIESDAPLTPGPISDWARLRQTVRASMGVRVFVKDVAIPPHTRTTAIELTSAVTSTGKTIAIPPGAMRLHVDDSDLSLVGTFRDLGQGAVLQILAAPVGSSKFMAAGVALLSGNQWTLPRLRLEAPADQAVARFRVIVIAAPAELAGRELDYAEWQAAASGASKALVLETSSAAVRSSSDGPTIRAVAGVAVDTSSLKVVVSQAGPFDINADGVRDSEYVYLARASVASDDWTLTRATKVGDTWVARPSAWGTDPSGSSEHDAVVIVTRSPLPSLHGTSDWWRGFAVSTSPYVRVASNVAERSGPRVWLSEIGFHEPWLPAAWILTLVALAVLEWQGRVVSQMLHVIGVGLQQAIEYGPTQVTGMPTIAIVPTVLGLILLGLDLFVITNYFDISAKVLRSALGVSAADGRGLAIVLITSTALAGLAIDVTLSRRRGPRFVTVGLATALCLIAAALLAFQSFVALQFYQGTARVGSQAPFALATITMFVCALDIVTAFFVSVLALDGIAWAAVHLLVVALHIVKYTCDFASGAFRMIPSREPAATARPVAAAN
jgi:hypothetical protein